MEEKRKRGRPKKGDEVIEPIRRHTRPQITDKNKVKYAEKTIRNAELIYKKYDKPLPNPLNIDDKDLPEDAKNTWKYIFSTREYVPKAAPPRAFETMDEFLFAFEMFCSHIRDRQFMESCTRPSNGDVFDAPIVPNVSTFSRWIGVSSRAVYNYLTKFATDSDVAVYKKMLADLLSEGASKKAYDTTMSIFSLKNLCDWADKREDRVVAVRDDSTVEEAKENLEKLGYTRPHLLETGNE